MNHEPEGATDSAAHLDSEEASSGHDATSSGTRPCLHVRPTDPLLDPKPLRTQLERLHRVVEATNSGASGIQDALFETSTLRGTLGLDETTPHARPPRDVPCRVGCPEPTLEYSLGCEPARQVDPVETVAGREPRAHQLAPRPR
jgi:hypothetical protein